MRTGKSFSIHIKCSEGRKAGANQCFDRWALCVHAQCRGATLVANCIFVSLPLLVALSDFFQILCISGMAASLDKPNADATSPTVCELVAAMQDLYSRQP